jgi:hypothetical protein
MEKRQGGAGNSGKTRKLANKQPDVDLFHLKIEGRKLDARIAALRAGTSLSRKFQVRVGCPRLMEDERCGLCRDLPMRVWIVQWDYRQNGRIL